MKNERILGYNVARELTDLETAIVSGAGPKKNKQGECGDQGKETTWCNGSDTTYQDDCK